MRYRVGTRGSNLSLAQTKQVIEKLKSALTAYQKVIKENGPEIWIRKAGLTRLDQRAHL